LDRRVIGDAEPRGWRSRPKVGKPGSSVFGRSFL
jgi:hypothetical protein